MSCFINCHPTFLWKANSFVLSRSEWLLRPWWNAQTLSGCHLVSNWSENFGQQGEVSVELRWDEYVPMTVCHRGNNLLIIIKPSNTLLFNVILMEKFITNSNYNKSHMLSLCYIINYRWLITLKRNNRNYCLLCLHHEGEDEETL